MYKYVVSPGEEMNIATIGEMPIKEEVIEQTAGFIHARSTYSNGWVIDKKSWANKIEFYSNVELIKQSDGRYHPKF